MHDYEEIQDSGEGSDWTQPPTFSTGPGTWQVCVIIALMTTEMNEAMLIRRQRGP